MRLVANFTPRVPFYYGWVIVISAGIVLFITYGTQYSVGIFFAAIEKDLGWSRAELSLAFTLYVCTYTTMSTISGRLTDHLGPRKVVMGGGFLLGTGLFLLSQVHAPWQYYLYYGLIAGLGMSIAYVPCTTTVVRWFTRQQGLALSLTTLGSSMGIFVMPLLIGNAVNAWGWRTSYLVVGGSLFLTVLIASMFLLKDPKSSGMPLGNSINSNTTDKPSLTLSQAARTRPFWLFAAAIISLKSVGLVPFAHLPSMIVLDNHGTIQEGALVSSMIGAGAILGVTSSGPILDRFGHRVAAIAMSAVACIAFTGFFMKPEFVHVFAFVFGSYYGASLVLMPAIAGNLFGKAHVGAVFGFIFAGIGIVGSLVNFGAGLIHDSLGSYNLVFYAGSVLCLISMGFFSLLRMSKSMPQ